MSHDQGMIIRYALISFQNEIKIRKTRKFVQIKIQMFVAKVFIKMYNPHAR